MSNFNVDLKGKRALVTGANGGIGAAISQALAQAGARLAVNYMELPETAVELVKALNQAHGAGTAMAVEADLRKPEAIERMFAQVESELGGLDILVNNAGIDTAFSLLEMPVSEWDRTMETNLRGAFLCAQAAARIMVRQGTGGVILNIASIHDTVARISAGHYCASKAGLSMLGKVMALELAEHGIRVVNISPGAIETPRNRELINAFGREWFEHWIPAGRLGQVDEVARLTVFLASEAAGYITGTTVYIDGAYSTNLVRYDPRYPQEGLRILPKKHRPA